MVFVVVLDPALDVEVLGVEGRAVVVVEVVGISPAGASEVKLVSGVVVGDVVGISPASGSDVELVFGVVASGAVASGVVVSVIVAPTLEHPAINTANAKSGARMFRSLLKRHRVH